MIPTSRSLGLVGMWAGLGWVVSLLPLGTGGWIALGGVLAGVLVLDGIGLSRRPRPTLTRVLPTAFALGRRDEVVLELQLAVGRPVEMEIFDGIPDGAEVTQLPWRGELSSTRVARLSYGIRFVQRGRQRFGRVHYRMASPLRLWWQAGQGGEGAEVKVYPDYQPVVRYALLAMAARQDQMGIIHRSVAGNSRDFHQLRDYREGDPLSQIDWKASSRRLSLISRDYREPRDQTLIFLTDTGRRMRALDGEWSQFDHAINAMLLLAYVALRQGDEVGVQSFGGSDRWLSPVKGAAAMAGLLDHLFDYRTTPDPSDFAAGVERLQRRQRRRALVLVLTNLRSEDAPEVLPALRGLAGRHLVVLVSLREQSVERARREPVDSFGAARRFAAAERYHGERMELLSTLRGHGVLTLDVSAQELPVALANRYLDIKARGAL